MIGNSPAEGNGDNASAVLGDPEEHGHCEIEMRSRRIAPTTIVTWKCIIWRAEIGGGDEN